MSEHSPLRDSVSESKQEPVAFSKPPVSKGELFSVMVMNVPAEATKQSLADTFSKYGEVVDIHIPRDKYTGGPRNFAFVRYATDREANEALSAKDLQVNGKDITVQSATAPRARERRDDRRDRHDDRRDSRYERRDTRDDRGYGRDRYDDRDRRGDRREPPRDYRPPYDDRRGYDMPPPRYDDRRERDSDRRDYDRYDSRPNTDDRRRFSPRR